MKFSVFAACGALALSFTAHAQTEEEGTPVASQRCVSPTVLVPPFNNTPGALEQSRVAATTVEDIRQRRGLDAVRVCGKSALSPELSDLDGIDEEPLTEEEYQVLEDAAEDVQDDASGA